MEIIRDTVSPEVYSTIFEPINSVSLENRQLTLELPSLWYKEILEEHYVDLLRTSIRKLLGNDARLRYKVLVERGKTPAENSSITITSSPRKAVKNPLMMPVSQSTIRYQKMACPPKRTAATARRNPNMVFMRQS